MLNGEEAKETARDNIAEVSGSGQVEKSQHSVRDAFFTLLSELASLREIGSRQGAKTQRHAKVLLTTKSIGYTPQFNQ
jgi:hypothetical protein